MITKSLKELDGCSLYTQLQASAYYIVTDMCFHLNDAAFCLQPVIKNIVISPNIHFCNSYNIYVYLYIYIYIDVDIDI